MLFKVQPYVREKVGNLILQENNKVLGKKLYEEKELTLPPFDGTPFSGWSNWECDPFKNRSWQWRLNWLSFLPYLIAYHHSLNNEKVLDFSRDVIDSWLKTYLDTDSSYPFEFIWHDHATALRAEQLVFFLYYCREYAQVWSEQNSEFLEYLEHALIVHGEWLAKYSFYSEHTNHGLEQARVLLLLGTVFEGGQAKEWQLLATHRISNELSFAFTDEGVHVENSPAYHIFVFKVFLGIIKDYPEDVLGKLAAKFDQFSQKALNFITHILRPDRKLPPIGDTEQLPTSDGYKEFFGHTEEYQHLLYALSGGMQGKQPDKLNRVYPKSGYAVFRNEWPDKDNYDRAFHIIAKVGCSSRYHHQQDEGHISIFAGGEDWLIDSGLYNYINKDPVRRYMRGRQGHNVPAISDASYSKDFEHRLKAWKVSDYSEDALNPSVGMKIDVLVPIMHERRVRFVAPGKLVEVSDTIESEDAESRNITLQWHLPLDKKITVKDNQVLVSGKGNNLLTISFEGEVPDNISVARGTKDERILSCISLKANQVEDSQLVRVVFNQRRSLNVLTRFAFSL